ncbi:MULTISPECIES: hypothetical protein [unclassified Kribbella]|uniref:hypothetical protein n=1 Tax=unclassified Kribbella TaxID=2644121 RepID=UPI0030783C7B
MPDEQSDERRLSLQERLALVYERLDKLPPVSKPEEAFKQLATTLDEVEDEFSGVPRNPDPGLKFDGRMYPPREDFTERTEDGGLQATTRGNIVNISPNGTMSILSRKSGEEVYRKPGADLGEKNTLDANLRKIQSLAATDYPPPGGSTPASTTGTQPAPKTVQRKSERDDRTKGR